ncbi:hypothetical protein L6R52_08905 [Myxococcota bacterium]|nr:hypothetical protein [Myxococcota bacterium]
MARTGYKAGDEVDSKCTKCKMVLAHTIVAMVGDAIARVKCNTCNGEHAYRAPLSASEATAKKRRAERKTGPNDRGAGKASPSDYEILMKGKDVASAQPYAPTMALTRDDVVQHPKFGMGVVTEIRDGSKAHIAFPDGGRILVFGRA